MPLRKIGRYRAWVDRESPPLEAQQVVRSFLVAVGVEPWRAPSVPIAQLSKQPEYEVRSAVLVVFDLSTVQVWYRHFYATGAVDVIEVTGP